jgi:hypothetical protein
MIIMTSDLFSLCFIDGKWILKNESLKIKDDALATRIFTSPYQIAKFLSEYQKEFLGRM